MAGLYSIIEGATGHRDALIWPALGKSREAFTAMLVAANSYYLSLASASAEEARRNTETIEKTIPVMSDLADNDLQRMALTRLNARTLALREGFAKLTEQLANRTELLRNTIDASQADAIGATRRTSAAIRPATAAGADRADRLAAAVVSRREGRSHRRGERTSGHMCLSVPVGGWGASEERGERRGRYPSWPP